MPAQRRRRDQSQQLTGKQRRRLTEVGMDVTTLDRLAQETQALIEALLNQRMTIQRQREILMEIDKKQEQVRRITSQSLFKMAVMGADLEPKWELD